MSNDIYTPPQSVNTQPKEPVVETKVAEPVNVPAEPVEPVNPVTEAIKPEESTKVIGYKASIDRYIDARTGVRALTNEQLGLEQALFMELIANSLKLDYPDFVAVMDYLIKTIRRFPKVFALRDRTALVAYIDKQQFSEDAKRRFQDYMEAIITLAKNMENRARIGQMIDIPMLSKGLFPKAVNNINTYFTQMYG